MADPKDTSKHGHEHGYECYFEKYGDKMEDTQCGQAPYSEEQMREIVEALLDARCDDFRTARGDYHKDFCGHNLIEHEAKGCTGSWHHSRCGGDHDCGCTRTRNDLIELVLTQRRGQG